MPSAEAVNSAAVQKPSNIRSGLSEVKKPLTKREKQWIDTNIVSLPTTI